MLVVFLILYGDLLLPLNQMNDSFRSESLIIFVPLKLKIIKYDNFLTWFTLIKVTLKTISMCHFIYLFKLNYQLFG